MACFLRQWSPTRSNLFGWTSPYMDPPPLFQWLESGQLAFDCSCVSRISQTRKGKPTYNPNFPENEENWAEGRASKICLCGHFQRWISDPPPGVPTYDFAKSRTRNQDKCGQFGAGSGADPGGGPTLTLGFEAPKLSIFGPYLIFPLFFLPRFARHIISLICCLFIVQIEKFSSLALLGM